MSEIRHVIRLFEWSTKLSSSEAHLSLSLFIGRELSWRNISWLLLRDRNTSVCTECFTMSCNKKCPIDRFKTKEKVPNTWNSVLPPPFWMLMHTFSSRLHVNDVNSTHVGTRLRIHVTTYCLRRYPYYFLGLFRFRKWFASRA